MTSDTSTLSTRQTSSSSKVKPSFSQRFHELVKEIWNYRLSYLFILPFMSMFILFILIPVVAGVWLSFTYFNGFQFPVWRGWLNYQNLFSQDIVFLQNVVPNTFKFAVFVGPVGYILSFLMAWLIAQLPKTLRTGYALAMYAPSLSAGVAMTVVWTVMFSGDRSGYINSFLIEMGILKEPIFFLLDKDYLLNIMIGVSIWSSMGIGFLSILAGILNVDKQLYEAGKIDGISSRLQEVWYITVPMMKPQLMFAAIMSIVGTIKAGNIGVQLSGTNPTPNYAGQLLIDHLNDYGFIRFELGYACAISVVILLVSFVLSKVFGYLFEPKEDE